MAKELPYFKFEPSAWENGSIQLCSFEVQGVFMNVCSMYWQRLGDLPYKLAVQKICSGNATALDSLCEEGVIKVIEGMICIDFLNEQLAEFENTSNKNSENARLGWEKRRNNATVMRPHSEPNAIREDKRREEKIKKEPSINFSADFYQSASEAFEEIKNDQIQMERLLMIVRNSGFRGCNEVMMTLAMKHFFTVESAKPGFLNRPRDDIKQHLVNWTNKNAKTIDQYAK